MKAKIILPILVLFICSSFNTSNTSEIKWGKTGHRTVGKIADQHLNAKAKRNVRKLLNRKSLAFVSTFADEIKADKGYNNLFTWHYVNMPLDANYTDSEKNPKGDLVTGIAFCKNIIKDKNSSNDDKAFYLKLLVHLIGDLHQPMHIGKAEDRGGNDIKLQWFNKDTNLHRVWDKEMINSFGMSYIELANNADVLSRSQVKAIQEGSVIDWVNETHMLSNKVYASVTEGENLRYSYSYNHFETARKQLQIAGIRLAKVLNELF